MDGQFTWRTAANVVGAALVGTLLALGAVEAAGAFHLAVISAFIPQVWSGRVLSRLYDMTVHAGFANREYEGEISQAGDTVKVPTYNPVITVAQNTGGSVSAAGARTQAKANLAVQDIDVGETQDLVVDKAATFNFRVHDIDAAQSSVTLMDGAMNDASMRLAYAVDDYCKGLFNAVAVPSSRLVTDGQDASKTAKAHGESYIQSAIALAEAMDGANIPMEGRWMIVPPKFFRRIQRYLTDKGGVAGFEPATAEAALRNGFMGSLSGFMLYGTTRAQVQGAGNTAKVRCFAGAGTEAFSLVMQVTEMEALRDQDRFADKARGLLVWGGRVVLPERIFRLDINNVAAA